MMDPRSGGTPSASSRHALCRADILPVRTSTVADKWNCPWAAAAPPIVLSSLSRAVHRAKEIVMTLFTRNLGAVVLATAWLLSVPQGTFSQANAQAQSPSPGPSDRTTAIPDQKLDAAAAVLKRIASLKKDYEEQKVAAPASDKKRIA